MTTSFLGKVIGVSGNQITLELDEPYDLMTARRYSGNSVVLNELRIVDNRMISLDQRGKLFGLFRDISEHLGYPIKWVKDMLCEYYAILTGLHEFSLSDTACTLVQASELIELTLEFCFENDIPLQFQEFHIASDISRILFLQTKYRRCFICGKEHSNIIYYNTSKMQNNNQEKRMVMCLCQKHHKQQQEMGIKSFMKNYHIVPIKLNYDTLIELGLEKKKGVVGSELFKTGISV